MKTIQQITLQLALLTFLIGGVVAQDDFYPTTTKDKKYTTTPQGEGELVNDNQYSTATDYYYDKREKEQERVYNDKMGITDSTTYYEDEEGNVRVTNNYYYGDNYDLDNEYYDYEYSSRIRRFHRNRGRSGYYDDYYTNYYWYDYDPYNYGTSIYTSFNWWRPRYSGLNAGWSYNGGWNIGWSWGWGSTGSYGYYGSGGYNTYTPYWGGHHHHHNYHGGYYANNYYNSYDRNSHYYGKRGRHSGTTGYGRRASSRPTAGISNKHQTFGQKYESAVRNTTAIRNGAVSSPRARAKNGGSGNVRTVPNRGGNNSYTAPRTTTTQTKNGGSGNVRTTSNRGGNNSYTTPRTSTQPKSGGSGNVRTTSNSGGNSSYSRPRTTTQPKNGGSGNVRSVPNRGGNNSYTAPRNTYSKPKKIVL
jgi:hypothetical protein